MSEKMGERTQVSLEKSLKIARLVEGRIVEVSDLLKSLIVKLADIETTIQSSWIFLMIPDNMADALQNVSADDLEVSFEKCNSETLDKIALALKNINI